MRDTVVKPGAQTSFPFNYHMGPGMAGKHHFQVVVKTNDPQNPEMVFEVFANSTETK